MLSIKKRINKNENEIRCFNIITNIKDRKFGEQCDRLLIKKNNSNNVAGELMCMRCKAIYEIDNNYITLKKRSN